MVSESEHLDAKSLFRTINPTFVCIVALGKAYHDDPSLAETYSPCTSDDERGRHETNVIAFRLTPDYLIDCVRLRVHFKLLIF